MIIGEVIGRYANEWIMNNGIRRNKGVFEAETRLWWADHSRAMVTRKILTDMSLIRACYIAMPLYLCGFLTLGAAFQKKLSVGAVVMGWGIAEVAVMINTVAICKLSTLYEGVPSVSKLSRFRCILQRLLPKIQGNNDCLI